jgi:Mitochondrial carrier protein
MSEYSVALPRSSNHEALSDYRPQGTTKQILIHDGVKGLYRGLGPTITGYLPTWAIYFSLYDGIKTRLGGAHWSRRVSYGDEDSV